MKTILICSLVFSLVSCAAGADIPRLVSALEKVESSGKADAVGDGGKAIGILQFHAAQVKEGNRIAGTSYAHSDMKEPEKARKLANAILRYNAKQIKAKTGREATESELARTWNGGPTRWKKQTGKLELNLKRYERKVAAHL